MNTVKQEVTQMLSKLPEDCTLEDVQYHLYVVEKIQRGLERAEKEGVCPSRKPKSVWHDGASSSMVARSGASALYYSYRVLSY